MFTLSQFNSLKESEIYALKEQNVKEGRDVDYKRQLPSDSAEDKKEFLADVTSFANTAGGSLIIGVAESGEGPESFHPLDVNPDAEITRLDNILRDGIGPRLHGVKIREVKCAGNGYFFVVWVPRSLNSPHRVIFKGHDKFYARNSSGKYPLDVTELKNAFLLSETSIERIRSFRTERTTKILGGIDLPVELNENTPKIILHLVPLSAMNQERDFDLFTLYEDKQLFMPLTKTSSGDRLNFDGFAVLDEHEHNRNNYVQVFRNGCIELVDSSHLSYSGSKKSIASEVYEKAISNAAERFIGALKKHGISAPVFLMVSFVRVKGYAINEHLAQYPFQLVRPIDRSNLIVPEVVLDNYDTPIEKILKPVFDTVVNAAGWYRSPGFD